MSGTPLCAHYDDVPQGIADHGYHMLWEQGANGIQAAFDLKQPMRCDDAWYNAFLDMCRHGKIDLDTYAFLHGWPTSAAVKSAACGCRVDLERHWLECFLHRFQMVPSS